VPIETLKLVIVDTSSALIAVDVDGMYGSASVPVPVDLKNFTPSFAIISL
jgi:hypothetical protein